MSDTIIVVGDGDDVVVVDADGVETVEVVSPGPQGPPGPVVDGVPIAFHVPALLELGPRPTAFVAPYPMVLSEVRAVLADGTGVGVAVLVDGVQVGAVSGVGTSVAAAAFGPVTAPAGAVVKVSLTALGAGAEDLSVSITALKATG